MTKRDLRSLNIGVVYYLTEQGGGAIKFIGVGYDEEDAQYYAFSPQEEHESITEDMIDDSTGNLHLYTDDAFVYAKEPEPDENDAPAVRLKAVEVFVWTCPHCGTANQEGFVTADVCCANCMKIYNVDKKIE